MKITFSLSFFIAFVSMTFLIQELHDWAHVLTSYWLCGCFGTKTFDSWAICDHCDVSGNIMVLVWLAGPVVTYSIVWLAWSLMRKRETSGTRSFGFSLLFAANPFTNVLAAIVGGGDITFSMRMLFQRPDGSNKHIVAIIALLVVLALTVPPVLKAIRMIKNRTEKIILIPVFLLLPNILEKAFVSFGMNSVLKAGFFQEEVFSGTPLLVLIWLFVVSILLLLNYKSLSNFIRKREKRASLRI